MTRESRLILSLDEIQAVRWTCTHCHAAIAFALDQPIRLPQQCPSCGQPFTDRGTFDAFSTLQQWIERLQAVRTSTTTLGAQLTLEFVDPPR